MNSVPTGYNARLVSPRRGGDAQILAAVFHESTRCMPIYSYLCNNCGHELEALQKISDPPIQDCPVCNKPDLKKKVTAAAFRLKGTGWYETDFKNKGKKPPEKKAAKGADTAGKTSTDKPKSTKSGTADSGGDKSASSAKRS